MNIVSLLVLVISIFSIAGWFLPRIEEKFIGFPYAVRYEMGWYRLFTSGFLHADIVHLCSNMYGLASFGGSDLGDMYEGSLLHSLAWEGYAYPTTLFLICYLSGMLGANFITSIIYRNDPTYRHLGASAGVCAVMSAGILVNPFSEIHMIYIPFPLPSLLFLLGYLLLSFFYRNSRSGTSHIGHLVGCLYGIGFITYLEPHLIWENIKAYINQFL